MYIFIGSVILASKVKTASAWDAFLNLEPLPACQCEAHQT